MSETKPEKSDSNQISQEDLAHIRALAQKATPGPWICYGFTGNNGSALRTVSREDFEKICELPNLMNTPANASYIAAVSPDVLMSLIEHIEYQHTEIERLAEIKDGIVDDDRDTRIAKLEKMVDWLATRLVDVHAKGWVPDCVVAKTISAAGWRNMAETEVKWQKRQPDTKLAQEDQ